jgi:hypothetical protein
MFTPVATLLAETRALLDRWAAVDWLACDPDAVALAAPQVLRDADQLHAVGLLAAGTHELFGGVRNDGDANLGDWASRQTKSSKDTGRRTATKAKRMTKAKKTAKAAANGKLSTEQADRLAAARNDENAEEFDRREDELITKSEGSLDDAIKTAEEFRRDTGETPADRAERLWKRRSAACWDDEDGMVQGRQSLAGDAGSLFKAAFDEFVNREFAARDPHDTRTHTQKRADAVTELARHALASLRGDKPSAAERATVRVVVRYEDLVDDLVRDWAGEDERTGLSLSGDTIRRLCCDADIVRVVVTGDSQVIDVGRKTRTIPTPTRRAVEARDGGCTFPGCHCRDGIQVHHLRHWAKLGRTDLANLACLCWKHHRLVHEGGWKIELDPETQRTIWTSPDGRRLIGQRRATAGAQPRRTSAAA